MSIRAIAPPSSHRYVMGSEASLKLKSYFSDSKTTYRTPSLGKPPYFVFPPHRMPHLPQKNNRNPLRGALLCVTTPHGSLLAMLIALMTLPSPYALGKRDTKGIELSALIEDSCLDCHDDFEQKGDFRLDTLASVHADPSTAQTWLHVYDRVSSGEMPPKKKRFPPEDRKRFTDALGSELQWLDAERKKAEGRVVFRRLSATEYEHAVRDLLELPGLSAAQYVPADTEYHGIENVADMQELAYNKISQYLEAAEASLQAAVALRPTPDIEPKRYAPDELGAHRKAFRNAHTIVGDKLVLIKEPVKSQGPWGLFTSPEEPGYYKIRFRAQTARMAYSAFEQAEHSGVLPELLAGEKNQTVALGVSLGRFFESFNVTPEVDTYECTVWLNGNERLRIHCADLPLRGAKFSSGGNPDIWDAVAIEWAEIEGPLIEEWPPKGHRLLFGDAPMEKWSEESGYLPPRVIAMGTGENREPSEVLEDPYFIRSKNPAKDSKRLLSAFMERAYRRPVKNDEVKVMQKRVLDAMEQKICFQDAMLIAYKAILCSPDFLFVHEAPGKLSGRELATRLALYLWRSLPDERLMKLARWGALKKPSVLRAEAKRMLDDPRAGRFIDDFTNQWLDLDDIYSTTPDKKLYPEYDDDSFLVESMVEETRAFVREMIRSDLPIVNVADSDFAFLNARLAQHYDISGVAGGELRKVTLPSSSPRGGILTQGSMMKISADGFTTSPVKRGIWVLERILGTPPPPPPPNAGGVEPDTRGAVTIREQLDKHRRSESCVSCHQMIDPPGFALESFDVMGGFRTHYRSIEQGAKETIHRGPFRYEVTHGQPVDSSGEIFDAHFPDIHAFRKLLVEEDRQIARNILNRLLIHSTGAVASFSDRAVIEALLDANAAEGYGLKSLILSILDTPMFLQK